MENLIKRLEEIARREGIPISNFSFGETEHFLKEHGKHGGYDLIETYNIDEKLIELIIKCDSDRLVDEECSHKDIRTSDLFSYTMIYSDRPNSEIMYQKESIEKKL